MQLFQVAESLKPLDDTDDTLRHDIPEVGSIIGMRNLLAHAYHLSDHRIIYHAATWHIPRLRVKVERLLQRS